MKKPDVIVFDLGKVLVDFDYSIAARRIAARGRGGAEAVQNFIDHSPLLFAYEAGKLTSQQFYKSICAETGYTGAFEDFSKIFADIFTPIDAMVSLHEQLREAGFPTFIFSNTNEIAIGHIRSNFPFFSGFQGYVYSFEHGAMKPDPSIYEAVEYLTQSRGDRILYLDDREENVLAGKQRGWQAVQHRLPEETRELCLAWC